LGPLLKALGVTIWGLIALGLLAVFIFVGYEAALKFRSPGATVAAAPSDAIQRNDHPDLAPDRKAGAPTVPELKNLDRGPKPTPWAAMRKRFQEAAEQRQFATVLDTGKQLYDAGLAAPDDLLVIAHAFTSIGDCDNGLIWAERANDALRTAGEAPNGLSDLIRRQCKHRPPPPANLARNAGPPNPALADRLVRIGEIYYGFGDYQQAISAIQRGLNIGGASHLDEAYVYLGLAELKLNDTESACRAFRSLETIPNISPRTLKLWTLFADMRC
jgi:tetratricopeptide (TPR) repeat protein